MNTLDALADIAEIITGVVAAAAYGTYVWRRYSHRHKLESYLREVRRGATMEGQARKTVAEIAIQIPVSENDIIDAGRRSKKLISGLNGNTAGDYWNRLWFAHKPN